MIFKTKPRLRYSLPVALIAIGVGVSILAFLTVRSWEYEKIRLNFVQEAEERYASLKKEIEFDLHVLEAIKAFYDVMQKVNRPAFETFVKPFLHRHPGIQALEWIPRVVKSQREFYERAAKQDGSPDFQIRERGAQGKMVRAHEREEYFPVYYVEPYKGNETALGFDLASNATRKASLGQARDTGETEATARITLVQETGNQFGFLVFVPVYQGAVPLDSAESRRKNLIGFVLGVFRIGDILENAFAHRNPEDINLFLYDQSAPENERFLCFHSSRINKSAASPMGDRNDSLDTHFEYSKTIDVAGRQWLVLFKATPGYIAARKTWQPWGVLIIGLLFTVLLAGNSFRNIGRTQYIERLVQERTKQLSKTNEALEHEVIIRRQTEEALQTERRRFQTLSDNAPFGMAMIDQDGTYRYVNPKFRELFGYDLTDLPDGKAWFRKAYPEPTYRHNVISVWEEDLRSSKSGVRRPRIFTVTCKDGTNKVINFIPVQLDTGENLMACEDITERKRAEEDLRRSEEKFKELFDNAPVGYHEFDIEGRITHVNRTELEMLGYTFEERIGRFVWSSITEEEKSRQTVLGKLVGVIPPSRGLERTYRRKDGTTFPALIQDQLLLNEEGRITGIRSTIQDITERKRAEEALRQSEEQARQLAQENAIMAEMGRIISSTLNISEVYGRFAEQVHKLISFDRININLIDHEARTATAAYSSGRGVKGRQIGDVFPLEGTAADEIIRTRSGLLLHPEDQAELERRFPGLVPSFQAGHRSMMVVPLISKGKVIANLYFGSTKSNFFNGRDLKLAELIGVSDCRRHRQRSAFHRTRTIGGAFASSGEDGGPGDPGRGCRA